MTGSLTKAAIRARKLIEAGASVPDACKRTGYRSQNVYSSEWYKALGREPKSGKRPGEATLKARKLIVKGVPVAEAAKRVGIRPSTIYGSQWWRDLPKPQA